MTPAAPLRRRPLSPVALVLAFTACVPAARAPSPARPVSTTPTAPPFTATSTGPTPAQASTSSATATSGPGDRGLSATDHLERQHRLAQALPRFTPHYSIDFSVGADGRLALRVTLLAVLNSSRDLAAYQAQLRQYKAEALEFIGAQGDDASTYTVAYRPPEAAAL